MAQVFQRKSKASGTVQKMIFATQNGKKRCSSPRSDKVTIFVVSFYERQALLALDMTETIAWLKLIGKKQTSQNLHVHRLSYGGYNVITRCNVAELNIEYGTGNYGERPV